MGLTTHPPKGRATGEQIFLSPYALGICCRATKCVTTIWLPLNYVNCGTQYYFGTHYFCNFALAVLMKLLYLH